MRITWGNAARTILLIGLVVAAIAVSYLSGVRQAESGDQRPKVEAVATKPRSTNGEVIRVNASSETFDLAVNTAILEKRIQAIEDRSDTLNNVFASVFIVGAFLGLWGFIRTEHRTTQLHQLAVTGESASQSRVEQVHTTLLDASLKTLNLVNDTLALARDASGQAAETVKRKAKESLAEIDALAREVIEKVHANGKFKATIENNRIRKSLLNTAQDLSIKEGYIQAQDVKLSAACFFVKGMKAYDEGQSFIAESFFHKAADTPDASTRVLALFWRGYVFNNIGEFESAKEAFAQALDAETVGTPWHFELRRILVETEFFSDTKDFRASAVKALQVTEKAKKKIVALEASVRKSDESQSFGDRLQLLKGNIQFWAYAVTGDASFLEIALQHFADMADQSTLWGSYGRLSSMAESGAKVRTEEWVKVDRLCMEELKTRGEPRHVTLLNLTRLHIASYSETHASQAESLSSTIQDLIRPLDESECLYSQREKRNVPRPVFVDEVEKALEKAKALDKHRVRRNV